VDEPSEKKPGELEKLKRENLLLKMRVKKLEHLFRNTADAVIEVDYKTGKIKRFSKAAEDLLGYSKKHLLTKKINEIIMNEEDGSGDDSQWVPSVPRGEEAVPVKILCADGIVKPMNLSTSHISGVGSDSTLVTLRTPSDRRRVQQEMIKKNSALDNAISAILITDDSWRITYANSGTLDYWRYGRAEILGMEVADLFSFIGDFGEVRTILETRGKWEGDMECLRRDTTTFMAMTSAMAVEIDNANKCFVFSFLDVSDKSELQKRLREISFFDELTGLYNKRGFMTISRQLLNSVKRKQPEIGLLYVDMDNLGVINDKLGRSAGDQALVVTAKVLSRCFRESDIVARLEEDEFAILFMFTEGLTLESIRTRIEVRIREILDETRLPFKVALSLGYYSTVLSYQTQVASLLSKADLMMMKDKQKRKFKITAEDMILEE